MQNKIAPDSRATNLPTGFFFMIPPKATRQTLALCLLVFLLTSCTWGANLKSRQSLIGPTWILKSIQIYGQEPIDVGNRPFTLHLKRTSFSIFGPEEGQYLEGTADCNTYDSKYLHSEENNSILIIFLWRTHLYCGEDSRDLAFYSALSKATAYRINDDTLKILWGQEGNVMVFKAR